MGRGKSRRREEGKSERSEGVRGRGREGEGEGRTRSERDGERGSERERGERSRGVERERELRWGKKEARTERNGEAKGMIEGEKESGKGRKREGCTRHTGRVASRHSKLGPWERGGSRGGSQFSTAFLCGNRCERGLSPDHAGLNGSLRRTGLLRLLYTAFVEAHLDTTEEARTARKRINQGHGGTYYYSSRVLFDEETSRCDRMTVTSTTKV